MAASLPGRDGLIRLLTDPGGPGIPPDKAGSALVYGNPAQVAAHFAALAGAGVQRIVVSLAAGDWYRQASLLAEARDTLARSM
jgi:hypothetical protein